MIIYIDDAIKAINNGRQEPDAFYHKSKLIATSKWVNTDGMRGYTSIEPEQGYTKIKDSWITGNWSDAPSGHSETEVLEIIKKYEKEYETIYVIFASTSNVFSTKYTILIDNGKPKKKGKNVGVKTKLFSNDDGSWSLRYHATNVISFDGKKTYTLNSNGWRTVTTKKRINSYLPSGYYISQKNFNWYLITPEKKLEFKDNMKIKI